jgi:O-succinylhomoserine sulfhydrylase
MSAATRAEAGIGEGMLRVAVGLEDPADICADLARGLQAGAAA